MIKSLLVAIFIFLCPVITLADLNINASWSEEMEPLNKDLERANKEIETCFKDIGHFEDKDDEIIKKAVSRCIKDYIAISFTSFCEQKTELNSAKDYSDDILETLKERLESKRNMQIQAVIGGIAKIKEDFTLEKKYIEDSDVNNSLKRAIFLVLGVGLSGGLTAVVAPRALDKLVSLAGKLGKARRQSGNVKTAGKARKQSGNVKTAGKAETGYASVGGLTHKEIATTVVFTGATTVIGGVDVYKASKDYIYKLAGTYDLCQI